MWAATASCSDLLAFLGGKREEGLRPLPAGAASAPASSSAGMAPGIAWVDHLLAGSFAQPSSRPSLNGPVILRPVVRRASSASALLDVSALLAWSTLLAAGAIASASRVTVSSGDAS